MRNNINIRGNNQTFTYVVEYIKNDAYMNAKDINWTMCNTNDSCVHLFEGDVEYFRHGNDWYSSESLIFNHQYIPENTKNSRIRVYIPNHSVSAYRKGIKYAVNVNTWINSYKIDLGTFIFKPTDAVANDFGILKNGSNEYMENIEFDIIDPFHLVYSDDWKDFRSILCNEPIGLNSTGSCLNISLYVIDEYDGRYMMNSEYIGGVTSFNISDDSDFMCINLSKTMYPFGLKLDIELNKEYNSVLSYLDETYNLKDDSIITYEVVIKNKDNVIIGPTIDFDVVETFGMAIQYITYNELISNENIKMFFSSWEKFTEGWSFVVSMNVCTDEYDEAFTIISNELPITQEFFSQFVGDGSEKIIDINDMNIIQYNVVNKIENKIVQIERQTDSKDNIIQPVFFKVKDTETLTLHPAVNENICINLDDYKTKVDRFILQIEGCKFDQIGSNSYGIIFKVYGNKLPVDIKSGTYYILNEDSELVTAGKYNCVK